MQTSLSKAHLRRLRNDIDILHVIVHTLHIEHRTHDRHFRFLCPLCNEFNTAINPRTNLARCFRCEQNFNPIDITMIVKQFSFLDTVAFLEPMLS